nr:hypothetical protein [Tanacetum cinerariifolium]
TVEDKILVPKPPNNCARCTRYGYWFDGPHCQGWALLRQELEENLVTYSPDFQNTSEPSNASTNVVNAPREPYVLLLAWDRVSEIKDAFDKKQYKQEDVQELFLKLLDDLQNIHEELAEFINSPSWNHPAVYDDDDDDVDYTIAITPVLSTEEPDNSLSMGDEHLDTILATESDEGIKSSVENLVPSPSEFKGIPDTLCDVH